MLRNRLVGLSLVVAWLVAPGLRVAETLTAEAGCQGHVCQCHRHCPPKPSTQPDCHAAAEPSASCEMNGRCNHDGQAAPVASRPDWLPSPAESLRLFLVFTPAPEQAAGDPAPGHSRIDPRPPRAIS